MCKDIVGYDMKYGEFKEKCRKAWSEKYICLSFDKVRIENEGKYRILS